MKLIIDPKTNERVFLLSCGCGSHTPGNELRFPAAHGRASDADLEAEVNFTYSHICDDCCCKDKICDKHAKRNEHNVIIENEAGKRTSIHPNKKYHHAA